MAGRQIRWGSAVRIAAIVVAAVAGIASVPALLGSDAPPPVPPDVGLTPPAASEPILASPPVEASSEPPSPMPPPSKPDRDRHQLAKREKGRSRPRPDHRDPERTTAAPPAPPPAYTPPPVYSYVPPPSPGEFRIER